MLHLPRQTILLLVMMMVGISTGYADMKQDEAHIQTIQDNVSEDFKSVGKGNHAETLAKQFGLPQEDVQNIRNSGKGWGEATIQLAVAERLFAEDQKLMEPRFNSYSEAVNEVSRLRQEGGGWGKISKDLGFKLGPVIRDAQRTRNEIRRELHLSDKQERKGTRAGQVPSDNREKRVVGSGNRPQKPERIAKPERPQRPERPARAQRPDRPNRSNRPGR